MQWSVGAHEGVTFTNVIFLLDKTRINDLLYNIVQFKNYPLQHINTCLRSEV